MGHDNYFDLIHAGLGTLLSIVGGGVLHAIRKLEAIEKDVVKIKTALKIGLDIDLPSNGG